MNLSLFSCQPNYRLSRSVTLVKAIGLLSLVFIRGFSELHFFSRQPNYRLYRFVTQVKAVSLLSLVFIRGF